MIRSKKSVAGLHWSRCNGVIWKITICTVVLHSELMAGVVVKEKGKLNVLDWIVSWVHATIRNRKLDARRLN